MWLVVIVLFDNFKFIEEMHVILYTEMVCKIIVISCSHYAKS